MWQDCHRRAFYRGETEVSARAEQRTDEHNATTCQLARADQPARWLGLAR